MIFVLDGIRTGKKVIIAVKIMINGESLYDNNTPQVFNEICIVFCSFYNRG